MHKHFFGNKKIGCQSPYSFPSLKGEWEDCNFDFTSGRLIDKNLVILISKSFFNSVDDLIPYVGFPSIKVMI